MKFCPECGISLSSDTIRFCPNCGFNISTISNKGIPRTASLTPPPIDSQASQQTMPPAPPPPEYESFPPLPPPPLTTSTEPLPESTNQTPTTQDTLKKFAIRFGKATGKAAFKVGMFTAKKLLQYSRKQLEDVIDKASKEEDSGIEDGVTGKEFESIVAEIFQVRKYKILQRNLHFSAREIDIVAARGDNAVMIECKARSTPVGTRDLDSYFSLFQELKYHHRFGEIRMQKLIIVAPKGGVTSDAKNKYRMMSDVVEFWEKDRFEEEYEKVKYE